MILTIAEDFTSTFALDSELTSLPDSGMYLNSGVHPSITVDNLLSLLPKIDFTFSDYNSGTTYNKYTSTRKASDIVLYNDVIYQSLTDSNTGNTPDSSPTNWLPTNIESLRIKSFALRSQNAALRKINLTRKLVDNQYLYNIVEPTEQPQVTTLPSNYAAWVFEPKGSDYLKIRINQAALQSTAGTAQNLYVINQGQLIDTLTLNTNTAGRLEFETLDYEFIGPGKWIFAIDSQDVLTNGASIDPLQFNGFIAYMASGIGTTPQGSVYSYGVSNNGLNFNVTAFLDAQVYIDNNLREFGNYIQAAWQLDVLNAFLSRSHNRSNQAERRQVDTKLLIAETKDMNSESVLKNFMRQQKRAFSMIEKTFDTMLHEDNDFEIRTTSY